MYLINPTFTKQMMVKLSVALNDLQDTARVAHSVCV